MHETGATEEDFALAAVRNRRNAANSVLAAITKPITVEDVLRSPPICSPIKLLDAPVSLDGAAAVVVASERFAERVDADPVRIAGIGLHYDDSVLVPSDGCSTPISSFVSVRKAAARASRAAAIPLEAIDVAELYAPFSPHELMVPEDIGWFERGGMIEALKTGATDVGGRMPINTDGGLLCRGHPWAVTPFYETITIVKQLRGEMGANQVAGAKAGLVHCEAGMLNDSLVMILTKI
jgi:acetyl-CoA acetyltransferase